MEYGAFNVRQVRLGKMTADVNDNLKIVKYDKGFLELAGKYPADIENGMYFAELFQGKKDEASQIIELARDNIRIFGESHLTHYIYRSDGSKLYVICRAYLDEKPGLINMTMCDVSESRTPDLRLVTQDADFSEEKNVVYLDYDVESDKMYLPAGIAKKVMAKYPFSKYWEHNCPAMTVHPDDYENYRDQWERCLKRQDTCLVEFRSKAFSDDDSYKWYRLPLASVADETGRVTTVFGRLYSIQAEKVLSAKLEYDQKVIEALSTTDPLTGLLNRNTFKARVAERLKSFDHSHCYALVYSDINDFSYINDNFGFDEGNSVLCDLAKLIAGNSPDVLSCRIYSDYFMSFVVSYNQDEIIKCVSMINNIFCKNMKEKYPASDIHISTGVFFFHEDCLDVTIAMDNANLARRSVKGSKDVPCGIYSESMRRKRRHEQKIASELHSAIEDGSIEMFLQPKFSISTREIIGAEALARWRNPDGSYKLPFEFVEVLEKVGYIVELDFYVYELLLKQMKQWKEKGIKLIPISVNFSRLHNLRKDFVERLISLADQYRIDKSLIEIEVTESAFASDVRSMMRNLSKLRNAGFKIDIDDFGIGYSSLSMLLTAPIDTVKVDKVFIDNLDRSEMSREYVKQICILIATTKKNVVFEGVETEDQAKFLSEWGFNIAQGWLFDKAISPKEFEEKYLTVSEPQKQVAEHEA